MNDLIYTNIQYNFFNSDCLVRQHNNFCRPRFDIRFTVKNKKLFLVLSMKIFFYLCIKSNCDYSNKYKIVYSAVEVLQISICSW